MNSIVPKFGMLFTFSMMLLFHGGIASNKSSILSKTSFYTLHSSLIENIIEHLNLDDFLNFQMFCEQSEISTIRENSFKFSKLFLCETKNSEFIEYINLISLKNLEYDFDYIHSKREFVKFSKLIAHAIQSSTLRLTQYTNGNFFIESKALNEEIFSPMALIPEDPSFKHLYFKYFCSQKLLHFLPTYCGVILMLFKHGEINFEFDKFSFIFSANVINFVSRHKTYLVRHFSLEECFLVHYISSDEMFLFTGACWESILMNQNLDLNFTFFVQNGVNCSITDPYVLAIQKKALQMRPISQRSPIRLKLI